AQKLDGRTEKRRQRLLRELENRTARGARELKPLDVLQRVEELLELGEPLASIRKVSKMRKPPTFPEGAVDVVGRLRKACGVGPETSRCVGIGEDVLRGGGVLSDETPRRRTCKVRWLGEWVSPRRQGGTESSSGFCWSRSHRRRRRAPTRR